MKTSIAVLLACCGIGITIASCSIYEINQHNKEEENEHTTRALRVSAEDEPTNLTDYKITFKDNPNSSMIRQINTNNLYFSIPNYNTEFYGLITGIVTNPLITYKSIEGNLQAYTRTGWVNNNLKTIYITNADFFSNTSDLLRLVENYTYLKTLSTPTITNENLTIKFQNIDQNATEIEIYSNNQLINTISATETEYTINVLNTGNIKIKLKNGEFYSSFSNIVNIYTYEQLVNNYTNLQNSNIEIQKANTNLQNQITQLNSQINNLQNEYQNKINTLQETNTTLQENLASQQGQNQTLQTQVNNLTNSVTPLQNEISTLNATINAKDNQINSLNLQIQEFEKSGSAILDIPGLMLDILAMPWAFISNAFDVTIFPNTPYALNFANVFKGLIAILTLLFIIRLFTNGFNAIGQISNNASQTELNKAKTKEALSKARLNDRTEPNKKE